MVEVCYFRAFSGNLNGLFIITSCCPFSIWEGVVILSVATAISIQSVSFSVCRKLAVVLCSGSVHVFMFHSCYFSLLLVNCMHARGNLYSHFLSLVFWPWHRNAFNCTYKTPFFFFFFLKRQISKPKFE